VAANARAITPAVFGFGGGAPPRRAADRDDVGDGEGERHGVALRQDRPPPRLLDGRPRLQRGAVEPDLPGGRGQVAGEQGRRRRLAGTSAIGAGGTFTTQIRIARPNSGLDCGDAAETCAIVSRRDHLSANDRTADVFLPVTFS
jgi:hypothetical protein